MEKRTTQWSNVIQEQSPLYITDIERQEQEQQRQQSPRSAAGGQPAKLLPAKSGLSPLVPPASPRGGSPRPSAELEAGTALPPPPRACAVRVRVSCVSCVSCVRF